MTLQTSAGRACSGRSGTDGFGDLRKPPRAFDQQPVEATATISACLAAWRADGDAEWKAAADARLRLVSRQQRSVDAAGRSRDRQLPRWAASRPRQRKPRRRVGRVLSARPCGDPPARARQRRPAPNPCALRGHAAPDLASFTDDPRIALSQATFLNRQALYLRPDPARVVVRPFKPATEPRDSTRPTRRAPTTSSTACWRSIRKRAASQLADVLENFQGRHRNLLQTFEARADEMEEALRGPRAVHQDAAPTDRRLFPARIFVRGLGAVQSEHRRRIPISPVAPEGGLRFILSLRAVGEGHVSSLTFRSGTIAADGSVTIDPTARLASIPRDRHRAVPARATRCRSWPSSPDEDISERVIFPVTASQSNGIEDARFVEFER